VRHYWGLDAPRQSGAGGAAVPRDSFSVRWTGSITAPVSGHYRIGIVTDDRGRMYIDDSLLVDNWDPCTLNVWKTCDMHMEAGTRHAVRIEYADLGDYAGIGLQWTRCESGSQDSASIREAVSLAARCDVVVIVAGLSPKLEGEELPIALDGFIGGDRTTLSLPANQRRLIEALSGTSRPVALVLTGGTSISVTDERRAIPSILQVWYPGQRGGTAVADVLFGGCNPAGRLPVTVYNSIADLPPFGDYDMEGRTYRYYRGKPLYAFGHGLSYTVFKYGGMTVRPAKAKAGDTLRVGVEVRNAGPRAGDEVVQVYARMRRSRVSRPRKWLVGFARVPIDAASSMQVEIDVPTALLRYWDDEKHEYCIEPGTYELLAGASSRDIRCVKQVVIR
jgi:beta-glucosidase